MPARSAITSSVDMVVVSTSVCHRRFGSEHEVRIGHRAHFGEVQALELALGGDALTDEPVYEQVQHEAHHEDETEQRCHTHQLCDQLADVPVEQPRDVARNTIPRTTIIAPAVGE